MAYTVYILNSQRTGRYYIGSTADLNERLRRHNQGCSRTTMTGIPWEVVCTEQSPSRSEGVRREQQIQRRKSRAYIEELVSTSPLTSGKAASTRLVAPAAK